MSEIIADEEVENILAEIRDRVRSQGLPSVSESTEDNEPSGHAPLAPRSLEQAPNPSANEVVAGIDSYLTVTSRAWDRLPPLVSNRSGSMARIELWVKRQIKRATHWFTWEQINFNAAAHHALRDTAEALNANQHALVAARAETEALGAETDTLRAEIESLRSETGAQRSLLQETQAAVKAQGVASKADFAQVRAQVNARQADDESQRAAQRNEMEARLGAITREMRDRIEHLQDEQRVCFKQLSLEATEASVLEDRARRHTEKVIEELRACLDQEKQ